MIPPSFETFPDQAHLWCFAAMEPWSTEGAAALSQGIQAFLQGWSSHGSPLRSAFELREDRLLLVVQDSSQATATGCSIDALHLGLRQAESTGLRWLDHGWVVFREAGRIQALPKPTFGARVAAGELGPHTPVLDLGISTLGDLRAGKLERPMAQTWHGRAFLPKVPVV